MVFLSDRPPQNLPETVIYQLLFEADRVRVTAPPGVYVSGVRLRGAAYDVNVQAARDGWRVKLAGDWQSAAFEWKYVVIRIKNKSPNNRWNTPPPFRNIWFACFSASRLSLKEFAIQSATERVTIAKWQLNGEGWRLNTVRLYPVIYCVTICRL